MNPYYYYGMSDNSEHFSIQERIKDIILHDSKGLHYSKDIPIEEDYLINFEMEQFFNASAKEHVLNYTQKQMDLACPIETSTNNISMLLKK